ncbi:hypothetical protein HHK36_015900 [Tetracentron sinense]|uniref:Inactive shikimate kinase like 1, chloroplastic n=1 Tax=Tetracentron sinense TaxID=13715 RepID=A0A834ZA20_TETSI|nr:hypothetical protein HHK36_015900 [Tetracentron sinense]
MEINVNHSSCRNLQIRSPLLNLQGALNLRFSVSFTKQNLFQKTSSSTKSPISPPLFRRSSTPSCSLSGNGSTTEVVEVDPSLAVKNKLREISPELKGTSVFLVGMNSTMKTSLGKLLADVLRYYYFDSESLVQQAAGGESAAKSFKEKDEKGYRDSETEVLKQLSSMGRLVVCAGDGAVQSPTNLAFLRYGISIWIDIPLDMVAREIENGSQCLASAISTLGSSSEVVEQLTLLYEETRGGYATADATISLQKVACQLGYDSVDEVTTVDMAMEVLMEIQKLTRAKKMMEAAARPF